MKKFIIVVFSLTTSNSFATAKDLTCKSTYSSDTFKVSILDNKLTSVKVDGFKHEGVYAETDANGVTRYSFPISSGYDYDNIYAFEINNETVTRQELYQAGNDADSILYFVASGTEAFMCD